MIVFSLESSAKSASAAIGTEEKLLGEFFINTGLTHSQTLMPMAKALLESSGVELKDIDLFAVSSGPGSFTGIRIGVSAIKGMAQAMEKKCAGVSTLEAMAYNFWGQNCVVCCAMDARCGQVYAAFFDVSPGLGIKRLSPDDALPVEELEQMIKTQKKPLVFAGDGADLCYNIFGSSSASIFLAEEPLKYQRASGVIKCALKNQEFCSASELVPTYLRPSQAERELSKKNALSE